MQPPIDVRTQLSCMQAPTTVHGCRTFTYVHLDASVLALWKYYEKLGMRGLWDAMPRPTLDAWTHIAVFGVLEAALQMLLPGKEHKGPVTPNGNVPVYKVHKVADPSSGRQGPC